MKLLRTGFDGRAWLALSPLIVAHVALLVTWDLAARLVVSLALLLLASVALLVAVRSLRRVPLSTATVLLGAVILRALLLPVPPTLSDDVLRYVWDGKVAGAGLNPYLLSPQAEALEPLRDDLWEQLPHKETRTVYPPLAISVFALAARTPVPVTTLKILVVMADIATCWLLMLLADRRGVARSRVLLYAWNPLVVVELAGMGHVDGLGVLTVVAVVALLTMRPERSAGAAVAAAAAVLAKVVPLLAWPVWVRHSQKRSVFLVVGIGFLALAWLPVLLASGGLPPGYVRFGVSWEFNGPLFEPLWRALDTLDAPAAVSALLDGLKRLSGAHSFWNLFYPFNYPQFLARLLLAACSLPFFLRAWRHRDIWHATGAVFATLLVFSSTVYPWYLLWVLPWAALEAKRAWLLLGALLPLSYLPQFLDVGLFPAVFCAIWLPFLLLLAVEHRWYES